MALGPPRLPKPHLLNNPQRFLQGAFRDGYADTVSKTVEVLVEWDAPLSEVVEDALGVASLVGYSVKFEFNGHRITCPPGGDKEAILRAWDEVQKGSSEVQSHMLMLGRLDWDEPEHVFLWLKALAVLQEKEEVENWAIFQTLLNHGYKGIPPIPFSEGSTFEEGWSITELETRFRWCIGICLPFLAHGLSLPSKQIEMLLVKCKLPYEGEEPGDPYDAKVL